MEYIYMDYIYIYIYIYRVNGPPASSKQLQTIVFCGAPRIANQWHARHARTRPQHLHGRVQWLSHNTWVCLKIGKTPKPNGFADHYPY